MFSENRIVYEVTWENTEPTVAFPLQQWLREGTRMLRYAFAAYLVTLR